MRNLTPVALCVPLLFALACSKKPKQEWSPTDHDRPEERHVHTESTPPAKPPVPKASGAVSDADGVWSASCKPCHGESGKGDSPAGRSLRAPDLTDASWQKRAKDEDIVTVIKEGRGSMPKFDLPEPIVQALIKKIRGFKP